MLIHTLLFIYNCSYLLKVFIVGNSSILATLPYRSAVLKLTLATMGFHSFLLVVKDRRGGLKGALGSCFGHFRCAFSACSPYAPIIYDYSVCMRSLHMLAGFRIVLELRDELSRVELDIIDLRIM